MDSNFIKEHSIDEKILGKFSSYKGKIGSIYGGEDTLRSLTSGQSLGMSDDELLNLENVRKVIANSETNLAEAIKLSQTLYYRDGTYSGLIDYLAYMYYYRYTVVPQALEPLETLDTNYGAIYHQMLSIVDGWNLSVTFPEIIKEVLISGSAYIYLNKNKFNALETVILPREYCKMGLMTQLGTISVVFDYTYFKDLAGKLVDGMTMEEHVLPLFPKEFAKGYKLFLQDEQLYKTQILDSRYASVVYLNSKGIPPKLKAALGVANYDKIAANEIKQSDNELVNILTHQIPMYDGDTIFDVDEALEIHAALAKALSREKSLKVLTTFGNTELISLRSKNANDREASRNAYKTIFYDAGLNDSLFIGETEHSLTASIKKDEAYIWQLIQKLQLFYTIATNNLYNFKPYQVQVSILPITRYNEQTQQAKFLEYAALGVGKLQAIVSIGIKQSEVVAQAELENFLRLNEILIPLQSAYTLSSEDGGVLREGREGKKDEASDGSKKDEGSKTKEQSAGKTEKTEEK